MNTLRYVKECVIADFFKNAFVRIKCPVKLYRPVISGLIETSLRGVDSHGIRLMPHYIKAAIAGRINLNPKLSFQKTSSTTLLLNADDTFGIAAATLGMKMAIKTAKRFGIGCVAVANSSHFGAAAIYSLMAARAEMIGLSLTNVDTLVLPFGSKEPFLGTNPICFSAPCESEDPFCLDMATSVISWNKVLQYCQKGISLETGWAVDKNGKPCLDPILASALLPIGSYKGYGLGLMVEILCSLLTNMPYGRHIPRMYSLNAKKRKIGHFLLAIDVSRFQEVAVFKKRMKMLLDELRSLPTAEGFDKVKVAGDPEKESYQERLAVGIPIDKNDLNNFRRIANILKIDKEKYSLLFGDLG